jgi:hypothetical protein
MNKPLSFAAATLLLASTALPAFAITGNSVEDGSANPVGNSMSMGNNTPNSAPLIKANSPVILDNKSAAPRAVETDKTAPVVTTHKHHHHHKQQPAPAVNADPMGAGR